MAYDPNDPKDKKIVDDLVATAVQEAREELEAEHEAAIEGLKNKNKDLIKKLAKLRAGDSDGGGDDQTGEIERLESELRENKKALSKAQKDLRDTQRNLETVTAQYNGEVTAAQNLLVENALTKEITAVNVAPHFVDAAKALLKGQTKVEGEGTDRKAVGIDGKSLGDLVKTWAQSEQGKHYIAAPGNGGSGGGGGGAQGGSKKLSEMSVQERLEFKQRDPAGFSAAANADAEERRKARGA